jgi:hypothetical protein
VHAVLYLVLAFVGSAALWLLLEAEFLGIVLVLVYVGAVMVLFLFVVMMLDIDIASMRAQFIRTCRSVLVIAASWCSTCSWCSARRTSGSTEFAKPAAQPAGTTATPPSSAGALHHLSLSVRDRRGHPAGGHRRGHSPDAAPPTGDEVPGPVQAGAVRKGPDRIRWSRWPRSAPEGTRGRCGAHAESAN